MIFAMYQDRMTAGGKIGSLVFRGLLLFHFTWIIRDYLHGRKFPTYWYLKLDSTSNIFKNPILMESHTPPETAGIVSIICLHGKPTYTYESPTHQTLSQIAETLFLEGLGQHVSKLLRSVNGVDHDGTIWDKAPEMVVFDCYVFGAGSEFRCFGNCDAAVIVFPHFTFEDWLASK